MAKIVRKLVLETPISDTSLLEPFVEKSLTDNVVLISVVGKGCDQIEDEIDQLVVADGSDPERFIVTTSHPGESLEEVCDFARDYDPELERTIRIVRL